MEKNTPNNEFFILRNNLVWLRKQNGLSQKQMAGLLGIGVGSLRKLEHGCLPPRLSVDFLFRIQDLFHLRPHILLASVLQEGLSALPPV